VSDDYFIDQMRSLVESDGVHLLISEAPYGQYMRQVIAGLKIVTSLERMGDHAAHLAAMAVMPVGGEEHTAVINEIVEMALSDAKMTREAVEAMIHMDADKATAVAKLDDDIDQRRQKINAMILVLEPKDITERENLYNYYYIAKELERLGDHVTNICAWIVYMVQGVKPDLN
ncbi:MAG: PhoU domain-containing protein, partial [Sphaerochaetaceae bacterium]